jgi:ABC-type cobalamin/Fe3+-siderophores transport system ATPase subunit
MKLSGGEFQGRAGQSAGAAAGGLFLDEAMSEMDVCAALRMMKLLRSEIAAGGLTVVAVHHDLSLRLAAATMWWRSQAAASRRRDLRTVSSPSG